MSASSEHAGCRCVDQRPIEQIDPAVDRPAGAGGGRSRKAVTRSPFGLDDAIARGIVQLDAAQSARSHPGPSARRQRATLARLQSNRELPLHSRKRS